MRSKHSPMRLRRVRRNRLALALVGAMAAGPFAPALAQDACSSAVCLPTDGEVVRGTVSTNRTRVVDGRNVINPFEQQDASFTTLTITQTGTGAIINWGDFSVQSGFTVDFQQDANAVILNRVVGSGYGQGGCYDFGGCLPGSQIAGGFTGQGHIFLVNRAGITFTGTAQVNVGGLVASTVDILDDDFTAGASSGSYRFRGQSGDGQINNQGAINAADGGTVGFIGTNLYNDDGATITANGGSVVFGAASSVTLDFEGDGLTQVTVNGLTAADTVAMAQNYGTITANGGQILMRAMPNAAGQGGVINGGILQAQTLVTRAGRVELTADGADDTVPDGSIQLGDRRDGYLGPGVIDVSGGSGLSGGSVLLSGGTVMLWDDTDVETFDGSWINASGDSGGSVAINASGFAYFMQDSRISANGVEGHGGEVRVDALNIFGFGEISASSKAGNGGRILLDASGTIGIAGTLAASGQGDGGIVTLRANEVALGPDAGIFAEGYSGNGGRIGLAALGQMGLYGQLNARGGTAGGLVTTASAGTFDIRGLRVDAGGSVAAGTWTLWAPSISVVDGAESGGMGPAELGDTVQDADLEYALNTGTNLTLRAGVAADDSGSVAFGEGVDIFYDDGTMPLTFRVDAQAAIYGSNFSISSNQAPLSLAFNADASGTNTGFAGIDFTGAYFDTNGGDIALYGQSDLANGYASSYASGVWLTGSTFITGGGNLLIRGRSTGMDASLDDAGVRMETTTAYTSGGNITIRGVGETETGGVHLSDGLLSTGAPPILALLAMPPLGAETGVIDIEGVAEGDGDGVRVWGQGLASGLGYIAINGSSAGAGNGASIIGSSLLTQGGDIGALGESATGVGLLVAGEFPEAGGMVDAFPSSSGAFEISSAGGRIYLEGSGGLAGVALLDGDPSTPGNNTIDSAGGNIDILGAASAANGYGLYMFGVPVTSGAGNVTAYGSAAAGTGVYFAGQSSITTTSGAIGVTGIGATFGLSLLGGELATDSGHLDLRGRGTGAASGGLLIGADTRIASNTGGIELSGQGGSGAGLDIETGAEVDAGDSMAVIRAANDGSSDALRIAGTVASTVGVNLRPGGVDATGAKTDRIGDAILLGGTSGFALDDDELARILAPEVVVGSAAHAGAIEVRAAISRDGNLTLQNGGGGGISVQAGLDVGSGTLALISGGNIVQTADGGITAHSLLASAGGNVLLNSAQNNVAATTLAGSAGGDFEFVDADALAIGSVSAAGFDPSTGALSSLSHTGITAGGDVLIRNLAGDLTLNAGITAVNIDLVTAGRLQNVAAASLSASGDWRVWASTWVGETRGGLAGEGSLPNLYGCTYLGACGVTVPGTESHFIYVQQPIATITFANATREYGLANPVFTYTVAGAILGDPTASVASGSGASAANPGSNVGNYAITGGVTSAAGYQLQFVPGVLAVTPATLLFTANSLIRYLGFPNPELDGSITGFRNGDTVESVFGGDVLWSTTAGYFSPVGYYPVVGGTSATNYVFAQAPGNATALQVIPLPQLSSTPIDLIRETVNTYVYDRNFSGTPMCAVNSSLEDMELASYGDDLSNEWSKVRTRPNLTNCFDTERKNSCGDF